MNRRFFLSKLFLSPILAQCFDWSLTDKKLKSKKSKLITTKIVRTGFDNVDVLINGFLPGELVLVAGRPSSGKSMFALNLVNFMIIKNNANIYYASIESSKEHLINRLISINTKLSVSDLRIGKVKHDDISKIAKATEVLLSTKLRVDERVAATVSSIEYEILKLPLKLRPDILVIDYLQLMPTLNNTKNIYDANFQKLSELKLLAVKLDLPILVISQMNRVIKNSNISNMPQITELNDGSMMTKFADIVMLVHKSENNLLLQENPFEKTFEINICQNKRGTCGSICMNWNSSTGEIYV